MHEQPQPTSDRNAIADRPRGTTLRSLVDSPWLVLALLFFVTAALGLPVLWFSRGFSAVTKAMLSVIVLLYTALLLWLTWLIAAWAYASITHSLR